jgi:predicted DsbA family dithiol-disulfide isomerase
LNRSERTPYTRYALEATEAAKQLGKGEEFHHAAYLAYWRDGVDLGKTENLKPIAESVGLDWSEVSRHLEHRTYAQAVEEQYQEALGIGVTGIPAYVIGRFFFMGAQPYDLFKQVAERALQRIKDGVDRFDKQ